MMLGECMSEDEIQEMIKGIDTDNDNMINIEEFIEFVKENEL